MKGRNVIVHVSCDLLLLFANVAIQIVSCNILHVELVIFLQRYPNCVLPTNNALEHYFMVWIWTFIWNETTSDLSHVHWCKQQLH